MEGIISTVTGYLAVYGVRVIGSVAIFIVGKWVSGILRKLIKKAMEKAKVDPTLITFIGNLSYMLLLTFVILAALSNLGVNTTSFIAVLGAAGLAVGLALQSSLSNFGAGVLLILLGHFKVGDYVEAGGVAGTVEAVRIFNTVLKTPDNRVIIVPNSNIIGGNIINYSAKETRRIEITVGVGYDDDLKAVKEELKKIIGEDERILKDPEPLVAVSELADSSVN
ncbi:MAG: mechanosensitive ion channel family protein, partial [Candidatus Schekmanbacteria bacterium]